MSSGDGFGLICRDCSWITSDAFLAAGLNISLKTPKTSADEPPMYFFLGFQGRDISQKTKASVEEVKAELQHTIG
ncbi:MAG: hypothetical protein VW991_05785, partial [Aquiluna sp.]